MSQRGEGAKRVLKDLGLSINDEQHERKQDTDAETDEDSEVGWRTPTSALGLDTSRARARARRRNARHRAHGHAPGLIDGSQLAAPCLCECFTVPLGPGETHRPVRAWLAG